MRPFLLSLVLLAFAGCATAQDPPKAVDAETSSTTPTPRDERWLRRHEQINRMAGRSEVDLVFLGDSITHGWFFDGHKVWEEYYEARHAANLGSGGDRTEHVLWRLENGNLEGLRPNLVVVLIGTNNFVRKGEAEPDEPDEVARGIAAVVDSLRRRLPKTKILVMGILPRGRGPKARFREKIHAANESVSSLADGKTVFFADIGDRLVDEGGRIPETLMEDALHLTAEGYRIWAEAIEPLVAELLGEGASDEDKDEDKALRDR